MPLVLPYPASPANGNPLDATPVLANIQAIAQAIQSFDGSQVQAGSLLASAFNANINPNTLLNETISPFVRTGLVWTTVSGLNGTMTGGTIYINGIRVVVNSVPSNTFAASKDTYVDVDVNGNITYQAVTNGAASPALTANSIRIAKIITGASITTITQVGYDSLLNLIYPTSPSQAAGKLDVGSFANTGSAGGTFFYTNLGGIKLMWGTTGPIATGGGGLSIINFNNFFTTIQTMTASVTPNVSFQQYANVVSMLVTNILVSTQGAAGSPTALVTMIGV